MFIKFTKFKEKIFAPIALTFTKVLYKLKLKPGVFNIFIDTKCLVLSARPSDETYAMGGFMAKHPKNFEVLSLTDGSLGVENKDKVDARFIRRKEFNSVMELVRVKGHKIFNIEEGKLLNNYHEFSKIDISEIDYIFVPNIFEQDIDSKAILVHLKKILEEKEHKKSLKIAFYELKCPLPLPNYTVDVTLTMNLKQEMMALYATQNVRNDFADKVLSLNKYRAETLYGYNEGFMVTDIEGFKELSEFLTVKDALSAL